MQKFYILCLCILFPACASTNEPVKPTVELIEPAKLIPTIEKTIQKQYSSIPQKTVTPIEPEKLTPAVEKTIQKQYSSIPQAEMTQEIVIVTPIEPQLIRTIKKKQISNKINAKVKISAQEKKLFDEETIPIMNFDSPLQLNLGTEQKISFSIGNDSLSNFSSGPVKQQIAERFNVVLHCTDDSFVITPLSNVNQACFFGKQTMWSWLITPKKAGNFKLIIQLSKKIGNDYWDYPTYEQEIAVKTTVWYNIKNFFFLSWKNLLAILTGTGALAWVGRKIFMEDTP